MVLHAFKFDNVIIQIQYVVFIRKYAGCITFGTSSGAEITVNLSDDEIENFYNNPRPFIVKLEI